MNYAALLSKSLELYPDSLEMRLQWRKWTEYLYQSGKHVLLTGNYPKENKNA